MIHSSEQSPDYKLLQHALLLCIRESYYSLLYWTSKIININMIKHTKRKANTLQRGGVENDMEEIPQRTIKVLGGKRVCLVNQFSPQSHLHHLIQSLNHP